MGALACSGECQEEFCMPDGGAGSTVDYQTAFSRTRGQERYAHLGISGDLTYWPSPFTTPPPQAARLLSDAAFASTHANTNAGSGMHTLNSSHRTIPPTDLEGELAQEISQLRLTGELAQTTSQFRSGGPFCADLILEDLSRHKNSPWSNAFENLQVPAMMTPDRIEALGAKEIISVERLGVEEFVKQVLSTPRLTPCCALVPLAVEMRSTPTPRTIVSDQTSRCSSSLLIEPADLPAGHLLYGALRRRQFNHRHEMQAESARSSPRIGLREAASTMEDTLPNGPPDQPQGSLMVSPGCSMGHHEEPWRGSLDAAFLRVQSLDLALDSTRLPQSVLSFMRAGLSAIQLQGEKGPPAVSDGEADALLSFVQAGLAATWSDECSRNVQQIGGANEAPSDIAGSRARAASVPRCKHPLSPKHAVESEVGQIRASSAERVSHCRGGGASLRTALRYFAIESSADGIESQATEQNSRKYTSQGCAPLRENLTDVREDADADWPAHQAMSSSSKHLPHGSMSGYGGEHVFESHVIKQSSRKEPSRVGNCSRDRSRNVSQNSPADCMVSHPFKLTDRKRTPREGAPFRERFGGGNEHPDVRWLASRDKSRNVSQNSPADCMVSHPFKLTDRKRTPQEGAPFRERLGGGNEHPDVRWLASQPIKQTSRNSRPQECTPLHDASQGVSETGGVCFSRTLEIEPSSTQDSECAFHPSREMSRRMPEEYSVDSPVLQTSQCVSRPSGPQDSARSRGRSGCLNEDAMVDSWESQSIKQTSRRITPRKGAPRQISESFNESDALESQVVKQLESHSIKQTSRRITPRNGGPLLQASESVSEYDTLESKSVKTLESHSIKQTSRRITPRNGGPLQSSESESEYAKHSIARPFAGDSSSCRSKSNDMDCLLSQAHGADCLVSQPVAWSSPREGLLLREPLDTVSEDADSDCRPSRRNKLTTRPAMEWLVPRPNGQSSRGICLPEHDVRCGISESIDAWVAGNEKIDAAVFFSPDLSYVAVPTMSREKAGQQHVESSHTEEKSKLDVKQVHPCVAALGGQSRQHAEPPDIGLNFEPVQIRIARHSDQWPTTSYQADSLAASTLETMATLDLEEPGTLQAAPAKEGPAGDERSASGLAAESSVASPIAAAACVDAAAALSTDVPEAASEDTPQPATAGASSSLPTSRLSDSDPAQDNLGTRLLELRKLAEDRRKGQNQDVWDFNELAEGCSDQRLLELRQKMEDRLKAQSQSEACGGSDELIPEEVIPKPHSYRGKFCCALKRLVFAKCYTPAYDPPAFPSDDEQKPQSTQF